MDYFYTPPSLIKGKILTIEDKELHHLSKVLRKKVGEEIYVVDGSGRAYKAVLRSISRSAAECEILKRLDRWNEPNVEVKLGVALLKNPSRFDFLVEKCTELGVREFIPMRTERTIVSKVHAERLQKIALAAMKQCGRSYLPPIRLSMNFVDALSLLKSCELKIITHKKTEGTTVNRWIQEFDAGVKTVGVLVGPEGGFTEEEVQSSIESGFKAVSLGPRRLRSETAAVTVVSLILGHLAHV